MRQILVARKTQQDQPARKGEEIGNGRAVAREDWWIQVETNERLDSDPTR
jgi:hypothetical protein